MIPTRATAGSRLLLMAMLVVAAGCGDSPDDAPVSDATALPEPAPAGLNEIAAIAVSGARVVVGSRDGVIVFQPSTAEWSLHPSDPGLSHRRLQALALAPDGTIWTAHASTPEVAEEGEPATADAPGPLTAPREARREGGVRAFLPDGKVKAYFAEQGLPSDDVHAIAVMDTGRVAVATSAGVALLEPSATAFTPLDTGPKRKLTVVDPLAGGATRNLTEFRPRDERVLSLLGIGPRLWMGTNHGLLALEEGAFTRVRLPSCRRDGLSADAVVALGARPDGIVAAIGAERGSEMEPSGLVEISRNAQAVTCHVPGVDVPASLTPGVASDGTTTWMATYEGLVRIRGREVVLFERGRELPVLPPMAVATGAAGEAWIGFWGEGIGRLRDGELTLYRFGPGSSGVAGSKVILLR